MNATLTSFSACLVLVSAAGAQSQPRYTVIDLGALGGAYSFAFGINGSGEVAGGAATPAQTDFVSQTAFLWRKHSGIVNLGVLDLPGSPACPDCNSVAAAISALGDVAVGSEIAVPDPNGQDFCQFGTHRSCRAAIWRNGAMTALQNLPGGNNANVLWINRSGQASGFAENEVSDPGCSAVTPFQVRRFQPVVWSPDGRIDRVLSPMTAKGDTVAFAMTINDRGQVVGVSGTCSTTGLPPAAINNTTAARAVLWEANGSILDLGSLGGASNIATSINNRGEVVGTSQSPVDGAIHAFRWTRRTGMVDYGAFPGAVATVPGCCHTINDAGDVVGFAVEPDGNMRALLWQGAEPKDLNGFVRLPSPFVHLLAAQSINDAGEIVGVGVTGSGEIHGFLATPNSRDAVR
jgi:probable HAF family extracellular repeat protein